jgi:hypothetical protein
MTKKVLVLTCAHSDPSVSNERFDWLGDFIYDVRPDMVVDLGDFDDMRSLNSYDTRYPKAIVAQSYQKDIEHGQEARDRIWRKFKEMKRKRPVRIGFEGNHENRIKRAISLDPRIEGDRYGVSFKHLQTDYWYDEYHEYENSGPSMKMYDGVLYAHFIATNFGKALSSKHHASTLLDKMSVSTTVGHSHVLDYKRKADAFPRPINGLVAGCFKGAEESWAGQANRAWTKGVVLKTNLEDGDYDFNFISLKQLEKTYG